MTGLATGVFSCRSASLTDDGAVDVTAAGIQTSTRSDGAAHLPAAQYVRMSTEHQRFSIENQADSIAAYASSRGFQIVRSYADEGKSGLKFDGRDALRQLIEDVRSGSAPFSAILVYDVSRWGRFQDADESAYYEFVCRKAGISVHYCAEPFENDGSIGASIIKVMKRAMAGEYSRELSAKVFAGQCRQSSLGFRQGGPAGFGLRRVMVDEHRRPKGELRHGERKSLATDRTILVPGPRHEVETVRRIFRLFAVDHLTRRAIADILNAEGIATGFSQPWSRFTIHSLLTNEKYIGNHVFNRISYKLRRGRVVNLPENWVRAAGAFEAIVEPTLFEEAQRIIAERAAHLSNDEMLERLRAAFRQRGSLTKEAINATSGIPSGYAYCRRFGSLRRAYALVGYVPTRDYRFLETRQRLRRLHYEIVATAIAGVTSAGGQVEQDPVTGHLTVNGELSVAVIVVRSWTTGAGALRWTLPNAEVLRADITIAVRMDADNCDPHDYYLIPRLALDAAAAAPIGQDNGKLIDVYRADDLERFYKLVGRVTLKGAA